MEKHILVGIDIGTSTLKVVFADAKSYKILTTQTEEIKPVKTENPDWIEYDPQDWLDGISRLLRQGFERGIESANIAAICFSGWTVTALFTDIDGHPLINAIHYNDMRHVVDLPELETLAGTQCVRQNGNYLGVYNGLAKQYWWKKHRPDVFKRVHSIHTEATWMVKRLTSIDAWNHAEAGFYGQYNIHTRNWDDDIINCVGFPPGIHPKLYDSWEIVGTVTKEAAALTGICEGTPVAAGADDASPVALTSGVLNAGQCFFSTGSAPNLAVNTLIPVSHPTIITHPHCIPNLITTMTVMSSSGISYRWARDALCQAESAAASITGDDPYVYMNRAAQAAPPGANGVIFLPYLDGDYTPNNDVNARGCFIGINSSTTKADMLRAVLEGVAFSLMDNMSLIRELGGVLDEIVLTGGFSKSDIWMQIISDVTGCSITLPDESEGTALGDALIAGYGIGLFDSYKNAVDKFVSIRKNVFKPDKNNHLRYRQIYKIYKSLYATLKDTYEQLSQIRDKTTY